MKAKNISTLLIKSVFLETLILQRPVKNSFFTFRGVLQHISWHFDETHFQASRTAFLIGLLQIHDVRRSREQGRSRRNHIKLLKWREVCRKNSVIEDCVSRIKLYRGADKSLAQPTSQCILFDGENISLEASSYIYIYIHIYIYIYI